jgi:hypothetical protein
MRYAAKPYRIGYHIHPVDEQGRYLPGDGMFSDADVYADTKPADDSPEAQAEALEKAHEIARRFLADPRTDVVYIRESHQPAPGQSWTPGPGVARITRDEQAS